MMSTITNTAWRGLGIAVATLALAACQQQPASQTPAAAPAASSAPATEGHAAEKQRMTNLGIEHKTARALYDYLKQQAQGGKPLSWQTVPDWTGVWTREASPF